MAITFNEKTGVFTLQTKKTTYQMQVAEHGVLLHLYYGPRVFGEAAHLPFRADIGFAGNPNDAGADRAFSLGTLPQECPSIGTGDFRTPALEVTHANGANALDLRYLSYSITDGKPALSGLPAVYCEQSEAQTLHITMKDKATAVCVVLQYSVLPELDTITRSCEVINNGDTEIRLETALSCCLDFPDGDYELISFYGRHAMERSVERAPLRHGKILIDSLRGASSHQQNPFVILCEEGASEQNGTCFGVSFVYSGNFACVAEKDQLDHTRLTMGINPAGFSWHLAAGESFQTPEAVLCCADGLEAISSIYHRVYREHLCRGEWKNKRRPVLINNWEATYFDFTADRLVEIAREASTLGVEMLVMDDGWFGKRNGDVSGLGDWTVNENKIPGGLAALSGRINALGMKLGIWVEPEMVSEDSNLYRAHPDWCLHIPGRSPVRARSQLVLDMSRTDVRAYLYDALCAVLDGTNIEYVKWDMNRHLCDVWSEELPAERQGELYHRFVLGLYDLMENLLKRFPHVLFEGCSGGGGRFDAGMLYYTPQIWCSDNTDAVERIKIQYGTSFGYPISTVGAHASASPNHQTGRSTPLKLRGMVAQAGGGFGYEMDLGKLNAEEKEQIKEQVAFYKKHWETITHGSYHRLTDPWREVRYAAWQFVSEDGAKSIVSFVSTAARANVGATILKLRGLEAERLYDISVDGALKMRCSGSMLMHAGLSVQPLPDDYASLSIELEAV